MFGFVPFSYVSELLGMLLQIKHKSEQMSVYLYISSQNPSVMA